MTVDIIITSASRPEFLFPTMYSIRMNVVSSTGLRFIIHEDVLNSDRSKKNTNLFLDLTKEFDVKLIVSKPRQGLGGAILSCIQHVESNIFFKMEDDWEIVKKIDLDKFNNFFNDHCEVNQIIFNKRQTLPKKHWFIKEEMQFEKDFWLTTTMYFGLLPAIWRTSFAKEHWKLPYHPVREFDKIEFARPDDADSDWYRENIGCYYYGKIGEEPLVKHIGGEKRCVNIGGIL